MNAKAKGSRAEYKSRRLFEAAGYAVTRAAGSLGAWDLVAIGSTDVVLCQVKCNRAPTPAERETLTLFRCPANCRRLVHVWVDRQRLPRVIEL
jgi:Holliday junction resolvase